MSTPDFSTLVARHRNYFRTGTTRSVEWREGQLAALRAMMTSAPGTSTRRCGRTSAATALTPI